MEKRIPSVDGDGRLRCPRVRARSTRPPAPPPAPPPNSRFGPYTLLDRLAVGGMAEVFRALEPRPVGEPRVVVVKRMLPSVACEPGARGMFDAEAELGAQVKHPNVVEVLGAGEQGDQPYLVLEYVRGLDLWRLTRVMTRAGEALRRELGVYVVREMLAGLAAVHAAEDAAGDKLGIVHRDVSPSNVLLSVHGDVKLGDFGIARATLREQAPSATLSERAKGKLGYLAPEQIVGGDVDHRADVFGAAVIMAELLMGRPLFAGGSELAVLLAIRDAKIHPFLEVMGALPTGLGEVVVSALARDPADRLGSADELRDALTTFQTVPDAELRAELADLVKPAMRRVTAADPVGGSDEATPLLDIDESPADEKTPVRTDRATVPAPAGDGVPNAALPPIPRGGGVTSELPVTADVPVIQHEVRTTAGKLVGPMTYAELVGALATGRFGPDDQVREGNQPFVRLLDHKSLRRHLPPSTMTPTTRRRDAPDRADEMVPLSWGGFVAALGWSVLRRDTGLWLCEAGGVRKEVYVKDGVPEFVTSNVAGELLGEYLVAKGVISRGELDMALAVMPRFEGKLGDTLAALGLVEPVHLFQHIGNQVREKLLDLFTWESGQAELYLEVPPPDISFPLGLDPWSILEDGIGRRIEHGLEETRFDGRDDATLQQVMEVPREVNRAQLPTNVRRLLATLHRPTPLRELDEAFADPKVPDRARRIIVLLMHFGAIEWTPSA